jgi:hypothetical protein
MLNTFQVLDGNVLRHSLQMYFAVFDGTYIGKRAGCPFYGGMYFAVFGGTYIG